MWFQEDQKIAADNTGEQESGSVPFLTEKAAYLRGSGGNEETRGPSSISRERDDRPSSSQERFLARYKELQLNMETSNNTTAVDAAITEDSKTTAAEETTTAEQVPATALDREDPITSASRPVPSACEETVPVIRKATYPQPI